MVEIKTSVGSSSAASYGILPSEAADYITQPYSRQPYVADRAFHTQPFVVIEGEQTGLYILAINL